MIKKIFPKRIIYFIFLEAVTILCAYLLPDLVASVWYFLLLVLYVKSDDEPFWLAFFLTTVDGFLGFLGLYQVTLEIFPGLPGIEVVQFYFLLSVYKAIKNKKRGHVFYEKYLLIILIFIIFRIIWGQILGFSGELNAYFRILKGFLPLLLFYSIPRLFTDIDSYERFFRFIYIIFFLGFSTQVFSLITGITPLTTLQLTEEQLKDTDEFRSFYNTMSTLMALLGAMFFLNIKTDFNKSYYILIIFSSFVMTFLSATRGWIIGFGIIILLSILFVIKTKRIIRLVSLSAILVLVSLANPKVQNQVRFSIERLSALEAIAEGDITASGTLQRLNTRAPRVMEKWSERPILGWTISDVAREYSDGHVANQNLLMTSGIVGISLLYGFLIYFSFKIYAAYSGLKFISPYKYAMPVFIIFLMGWFIIHSTSGQQFGFGGMPVQIIPQAVFFSFGALVYSKSKEAING
jgi:hypothetical protein